jgi:hypothetical protein
MPGSSAKIALNFAGETQYIIIVPRKTTAPATNVVCTIDGVVSQTRKVYPTPHSQVSLLVEDLQPVFYLFIAYRSADGIGLDEQVNVLAVNGATGAISSLIPYQYEVDRGNGDSGIWADPIQDDTGLGDTRLAGAELVLIDERGTGFVKFEDYTIRPAGGWDWNGGKIFNTGGVYTALVVGRVDAPITPVVSGGGYDDIVIVSGNITYDPLLHNNKILYVTTGNITFPSFATLDNCKSIIQTHGLTVRNSSLIFGVGDTVKFIGTDFNRVDLGIGETFEFYIISNQMYVFDEHTGYWKVGDPVFKNKVEGNWIARDGTQYNQTDLPRLMWYVNNKLPAGSIVAEGSGAGQWAQPINDVITGKIHYPNKRKYARDNTAGTIRVPDDTGGIYYASLDNVADVPMTYEGEQVQKHYHESGTESNPIAAYKRGASSARRAWSASAGLATEQSTTDLNNGAKTIPNTSKFIPCVYI